MPRIRYDLTVRNGVETYVRENAKEVFSLRI